MLNRVILAMHIHLSFSTMQNSLRYSSALLLGGLFMSCLQACNTQQPEPEKSINKQITVLAKRAYVSQLTGERTSSRPALVASQTSKPGRGGVTPQLADGQCYQIVDVYYDMSTGEVIGEEVVGTYCTSSGGGGGTGDGGGGSTPPTGGGGGGGTDPGSWPTNLTDPCGANTAMAANQSHTDMATNLRNALNQTQEVGYSYSYQGGQAIQLVPGTGSDEVDLVYPTWPNTTATMRIDGFMHTHTAGLLSTFSVSDLAGIYDAYSTGHVENLDTFTAEVYTAAGTTYSISITNSAQFTNFGAYFSSSALRNQLENLYLNNYNISNNNSVQTNELGLVKLLAGLNSGLTLSKQDATGRWNRLAYNASSQVVVATPCY